MATTFTADTSARLADQAASLIVFLSSAKHSLSNTDALCICAAVDLTSFSDFKEKAKLLRAELLKHNIQLGQSHALEALSRMAGFTSYMRAKEAMKQQAGDFMREGFLLRVRKIGEEEPNFAPYATLPKAANEVVAQAMALLDIPREPVFCEMRRSPQSVVIDVNRGEGPWFSIELLAYAFNDEKIDLVEFDAEAQRTFFERTLRALERGRPGTLVLYGVIPQTLPPWHYASFTVTFTDTGVRKICPDERELFFLFASLGLQSAEVVDGRAEILGKDGTASMEMAWNRYDGTLPPVKAAISSAMLNLLVERYRYWRSGLKLSINDAVMLVATGTTDANASHAMNNQVMVTEREKQGLSQRALADAAGLPEQAIHRIEKYGYATTETIVGIAKALQLEPNALVDKPEGQMGFEISEAQHLLNSMKGVHQYGTTYPEDIDAETEAFIKGTAEDLQDLGDLMAMQDGVFSQEMKLEPINSEHLLEHAEALLENIHNEGLMLIAARGVSFAKGKGATAGIDGMPLQQVIFRFQPRASANELAIWR